MNYDLGKGYSVFLMSVRGGAPYADMIDEKTGTLIYEGHDAPRTRGGPDPKTIDQPMTTAGRAWTEDGKFFRAATDFKSGLRKKPELAKVCHKITRGIWCYTGFFELIDARIAHDSKWNVFKFHLRPVQKKPFGKIYRTAAHTIDSNACKSRSLATGRWQVCPVRCNGESALRPRHPVFQRRKQLGSREGLLALCETLSAKVRRIMSVLPWVYLGTTALRICNRHWA
ncbi:MAG: HNH endonuclease [Verrucomicrobiia bacterium]